MDDGESCTMWMYLGPLSWTIKYVLKSIFYIMWLLPQEKIFKKLSLGVSFGTNVCLIVQWRNKHSRGWYTEAKPINTKGNQHWIFIGRSVAEAETPILWPPDAKNWHWKRPWCWERLKARGEGDDRGWDGWIASLTNWTWVWAGSGSWWWTGKPSLLQFLGLQRAGHDWATELTWHGHGGIIWWEHRPVLWRRIRLVIF